jgi:hypothetical protein
MKLTGAAMLVSRGMKVLQAAPAAYPCRSAAYRWASGEHSGGSRDMATVSELKKYWQNLLRSQERGNWGHSGFFLRYPKEP